MELDDFEEALDALVASPAANYGDGASIERLHRKLSHLKSFVTEATAAFEVGEERAADGTKTAPARLQPSCSGSDRSVIEVDTDDGGDAAEIDVGSQERGSVQ
jgi:hypothetical protein